MFHSSLIFTLFCLIQNIHCEPERKPTALPVIPPSREPTAAPSTRTPSHTPSVRPTKTPVTPPTKTPTIQPSPIPSVEPTHSQLPSPLPTSRPSGSPTSTPSMQPSRQPTSQPSRQPTSQPSTSPSRPTIQPTPQPTLTPKPTPRPSFKPSFKPTTTPQPSVFRFPTSQPSGQPSSQPFARPSGQPTCQPSMRPTAPTGQPSSSPSCQPSSQPSRQPSSQPTTQPSSPTGQPSSQPSLRPTTTPSQCPTGQPSVTPTCTPSNSPTVYPTLTHRPTSQPSMQPTGSPTEMPSSRPSGSPTQTHKPTKRPSSQPTGQPSIQPSMQPTGQPSSQPTFMPTMPTGQPTGQPSRQPSTQPTGQPSKQPTCQPSGQPSSQPTWGPTSPTGQPTTQPSLQPSNQPTSSPTCTQRPSSQPSSSPSMIPSSQPVTSPTSFPTDFHRPTSKPTGKSKPFPTSTPTWSSGAFTESPTGLYQNLGVTGSVVFNPENSTACTPVEIHIRLQFNRNIDAGSIFWITAPGLTSGPCGTTSNGPDKGDIYIPNVDGFSGSYVEGDYRDNYASSRFKFVIDSSDILTGDDGMYLVIDRNNLFRRTCTYNNSWIVTVQPLGRTSGVSGFIDRVDTYPQRCTTFYSALAFSTPMQQFPTAINVSMHFGYIMMEGSEVTIRLPGFTNKKGGFQLNDMVANSSDFIGRGQDAELYNLTWSTNYTWTGRYYEGDPYDKYRDSRIVLRSYGNQLSVVPFWVKIGEQNYLIPTCGSMINSTDFTIAAVDQYSFTAERPVDGSNAIGRGCSDLKDCSNHGQCDYCQSKCRCDDGFGSARDRLFTSSGDFLPDCSSRACPIGPSIGSLLQSTNGTDRNSTQMHGMYECSNNGKCQRSSGLCQCNPGYYGAACQKMSCHNRCSDRGQCMSMKRLATSLEAFPLSDLVVHYESFNNSHYDKSWDGDFGHTCVCDSSWPVGLGADETQASEFFGPFCQYRHCPSGDDPVTPIDETDCEGKAKTNHLKTRHTIGQSGNKCHVDCSNRGICDFGTGICKCFEGYGGNNCGTRLSFMKSTGGVTKHSRQ